jgi:hypothetical protein
LLEIKAPDGKPTKEQADCLVACEAAGAIVAIEYGLDAPELRPGRCSAGERCDAGFVAGRTSKYR